METKDLTVELVTPAQARQWLADMRTNRAIKPRLVNRYARQMMRGNWHDNGETLKFDTNGRLCDGQHRLTAQVQANVDLYYCIARNVTEKGILDIDTGGNRTAGFASYFILAAILLIAAFRLQNLWFTLVVVAVIVVVLLLLAFRPSHRRTLGTNVNNMDTMLLGGMWHGSSFNFITWGGLNGLGILVYKWWKDRSWTTRLLTLLLLAALLTTASYLAESPLLNLLAFCLQVLLVGFTIIYIMGRTKKLSSLHSPISTGWSVLITFVFISFTRLFFRSGSNLNPAEANEAAWNTASMMVERIGSRWNLAQVPDILSNYASVFILFAVGMAVHWLPTRFKRRYRLWFASMPLWLMGSFVVLLAVVLYQFVTADLQPFIYFQF